MSERIIMPQGTDTPTAMATTFERLIESLDADADAEVEEVDPEVADAAVVDAVDAGDGDSVALAVEAIVSAVSTNNSLDRSPWQPSNVTYRPSSLPLGRLGPRSGSMHRTPRSHLTPGRRR